MFLRAFFLFLGTLPHVFAVDKAALLAAIEAHPGEDTPRLAFADWLEEHEDAARAEFIRVQVRLARMDLGDSERPGLEAREKTLLKENASRWLPAAFGPAFFKEGSKVEWERGFVHGLVLEGTRAINSATTRAAIDELILMKSVDISCWDDAMSARQAALLVTNFLKLKRISQLVHLGLHGNFVNLEAERLSGAPLTKLISLELSPTGTGDAAVAEFLHATWIRRLRRLKLDNIAVGQPFWARLAATGALPELQELSVGPDACTPLSSGNGMPKLRYLSLGVDAHHETPGFSHFLSSARFQRITAMNLVFRRIIPEIQEYNAPEVLKELERTPHRLAHLGLLTRDLGGEDEPFNVPIPPKLAGQIAANASQAGCARFLTLFSTE